jgi:hypothetical protein
MTLANLPAVSAIKSDQTHFNNVQDAITGDILPRNASGVSTDLAASIGSSTYSFLRANVFVGYIPSGAAIPWYDFNGLISIPHGYMLCNGDQITQTKYNEQHRTSVSDATDYWSTYVGSSPLEDLYTPDLISTYQKGTTSATQSGVSAISKSGNVGNQVNLQHNHGGTLTTGATANVLRSNLGGGAVWQYINAATHTHDFTIPNDLTTQDITPLSIGVKFLIRIVE